MGEDRLQQIKQRAASATEGPWIPFSDIARNGDPTAGVAHYSSPTAEELDESVFEDRFVRPPDAEFIAHAREDVPWLVAEVVRLRGLVPGDTTRAVEFTADMPEPPVGTAIVAHDDEGITITAERDEGGDWYLTGSAAPRPWSWLYVILMACPFVRVVAPAAEDGTA